MTIEQAAAGSSDTDPYAALSQALTLAAHLQSANAELRRERDRLASSALRDPLTGAMTRSVFCAELTRALSKLSRRSHPLAVLFIDVDRLKQINDSQGHAAGDELIRQTVQRVQASVRPSDVIARIGGDEFVILLDDLGSHGEAEIIAQRLVRNVSKPCQIAPNVVAQPSVSVGVAFADGESVNDADDLLAHADVAMYRAKTSGRNRYELFDAAAYDAASLRTQLRAELLTAAPAGQLTLHYQPIFDLATSSTIAVEALLRWHHPTLGLLCAGEFIDIANESGLLASLGPWVITQACQQLADWDRKLDDRAPAQVFINLSIGQLTHPGLTHAAALSLTKAHLDPARLVIEITESEVLDNSEAVTTAIQGLLSLGCQLAIDDFGSGYSALSRLIDLPADILKIDQSFVQQLSTRPEAAAIIAAVLLLAHNLHKRVVAEGIEDENAVITLTELGCELAQGFHLSRPQPPETITAELAGLSL
jgi:diguanylate cyclase (GGDEF)-like protein